MFVFKKNQYKKSYLKKYRKKEYYLDNAPLGQFRTHNPQSKQFSSSIRGIFSLSDMAFNAHTFMHTPLSGH